MSYNNNGTMNLYHYSTSPAEKLTLEPEYFTSNTSRHSRKEKEVSTIPRVFFYANPDKTEMMIAKDPSRKLFVTEVPAPRVYDLKRDPEGFMAFIRQQRLEKEMLPLGMNLRLGVDWDKLLNLIKSKYDGVFYSIGGGEIDIVAWFKPIKVSKAEE